MIYIKGKEEGVKDIPEITVDEIPEGFPGFWKATKEEQKEIDEILAELNIDIE